MLPTPKDKPSAKERALRTAYPYLSRLSPVESIESLIPYWDKAKKKTSKTYSPSYNFLSTVLEFQKQVGEEKIKELIKVQNEVTTKRMQASTVFNRA